MSKVISFWFCLPLINFIDILDFVARPFPWLGMIFVRMWQFRSHFNLMFQTRIINMFESSNKQWNNGNLYRNSGWNLKFFTCATFWKLLNFKFVCLKRIFFLTCDTIHSFKFKRFRCKQKKLHATFFFIYFFIISNTQGSLIYNSNTQGQSAGKSWNVRVILYLTFSGNSRSLIGIIISIASIHNYQLYQVTRDTSVKFNE